MFIFINIKGAWSKKGVGTAEPENVSLHFTLSVLVIMYI
jgi:hypothetical protein